MRLIIAAILIVNISCFTSPAEPEPAPARGAFELRYGQTATIAGIRVSFTEIGDSRCPKDVVCAWEGDAAVRLEAASEFVVLHTNPTVGPSAGKLAGMTITLLEVKPEPVASNPTRKTDYAATIRVSE